MTDTKRFVLIFGLMLAISLAGVAFAIWVPDRWERAGWREAVVIRLCHKVPIVRLPDGTVWVRLSWALRYRVEDEQTVCPP